MTLPELLLLLLALHLVGDFVLQNDGMAQRKDPWTNPMPAVPWFYWMAAHAATHGLLVAGAVALYGRGDLACMYAVQETVAHFGIDVWKCSGGIPLRRDQAMHVGCKVGVVLALWLGWV